MKRSVSRNLPILPLLGEASSLSRLTVCNQDPHEILQNLAGTISPGPWGVVLSADGKFHQERLLRNGEVVPCVHARLAIAIKQRLRERFGKLSGMMLQDRGCINDLDGISLP